jgi:hypothetical protein
MLVQTSQGQSGSAHVVVLGNEKRVVRVNPPLLYMSPLRC